MSSFEDRFTSGGGGMGLPAFTKTNPGKPPIPPVKELRVGLKLDDGKLRYDLLPASILEGLVLVYTWGATKYEDDNWMKGLSVRRLFGAMCRHTWKWWRGEDFDEESGIHHMFHAMWNAGAIAWMCRFKPEFDDRRKTHADWKHQ